MKNICALFDLDGVVIDTETQYDVYWAKVGEMYDMGEGFHLRIKGSTMPDIMGRFFPHLTEEEKEKITRGERAHEAAMDYREIPGALDFIRALKRRGIRTGLVTSSDDEKMRIVFERLTLEELFDTVVTANRITCGKPNPECYLLAASELGASPVDCVVFEDSFAGIAAGNAAGMRVVGLSTTNPAEAIRDKVTAVIGDFRGFTPEKLRKLL